MWWLVWREDSKSSLNWCRKKNQAAPLIFCVVSNYHLFHKKWVGHKKWGNRTDKDFRWRNGESKSKTDMRHVSVAISGRTAADEVVPGYFHFMPARAQGAVKPPWHRPVWSHVPHALGESHADIFSFHPFTNNCSEYLCRSKLGFVSTARCGPQPRGLSSALPDTRHCLLTLRPSPWMLACPEPGSWAWTTHSQHQPPNTSFSFPLPRGSMGRGFPSQDICRECSDLLGVVGKGVCVFPRSFLLSSTLGAGWAMRGHGVLPVAGTGMGP